MTEQEMNKNSVLRWFKEVWNNRNFDLMAEMMTEGTKAHGLGENELVVVGIAQFRSFAETLTSAFPDMRIDVEDIVAQDDLVAARFTVSLTHLGPQLGIEPSGKHAVVSGMGFGKFKDGKMIEIWNEWDQLSLMTQIGAVESKAKMIK